MTGTPAALARLDELLGRRVSLRALALLRILTGPIVLLHLWPFLDDARHGHIYRDAFYEPYASWYPELPRSLYVGMLWLGAAAAVCMSLGWLTRLATATAFGVVTYNLFLSTTHFHNNRAYLLIILAALTLTPGRAWHLDIHGPAWPLWLLRFEASVVYGASGISKLLDHDWFSGTVSWGRLMRIQDRLVADTPLPDWAISLLTDRSFHTVAAKLIVLTEIFIAVGLWWRPTRLAAVWLAVCFHVAIEVSASVQVFSWLSIAALVIWATPSTRDRLVVVDPANPRHARLAGALRRLDWLGRFRVEPGPAGSSLRVVDRDGAELTGRAAAALVASRLPVTAWFALPVLAASRRPTRRESLRPDEVLSA